MLQELGAVLRTVDPRLLYNYIMWRVVMDLVPFLPPPYQVTTLLSPAPPDPLVPAGAPGPVQAGAAGGAGGQEQVVAVRRVDQQEDGDGGGSG